MPVSKKFVGRLPAHLAHLKARTETTTESPDAPKSKSGARSRPTPDAPKVKTAPAPDRLTSLIPEILRALFPPGHLLEGAGRDVTQDDVLAAFAPYERPNSRFERLMISRLVGQGYLRPRGARDKHGLSAAYTLTPKGEQVLIAGLPTPTPSRPRR